MQRICWTLQVKKDKIEEYTELHKNVWPEMQQALRETGWRNYSIFLRSDGLLIGYLETEDFEAAVEGMAQREVNARWQAISGQLFEELEGVAPDESMAPVPMVFHLD